MSWWWWQPMPSPCRHLTEAPGQSPIVKLRNLSCEDLWTDGFACLAGFSICSIFAIFATNVVFYVFLQQLLYLRKKCMYFCNNCCIFAKVYVFLQQLLYFRKKCMYFSKRFSRMSGYSRNFREMSECLDIPVKFREMSECLDIPGNSREITVNLENRKWCPLKHT